MLVVMNANATEAEIERDSVCRFAHANGLGHAGQIFEMLQTYRAFCRMPMAVRVAPGWYARAGQAPQSRDDAGDFRFRGIGIHDDEHKRASFFLCNGARCKRLALPPHPR